MSAAWDGKAVSPITMLSEKGAPVRLADPWKTDGVRVTCTTDGRTIHVDQQGEIWLFATEPGASYRIEPV